MIRIAPNVELSDSERAWLLKQTRSGVASRRLAERSQIVLLAATQKTNEEIAAELDMTRQKVARWRTRYVELGRPCIESDAPGRGRKPALLAKSAAVDRAKNYARNSIQRDALESKHDG